MRASRFLRCGAPVLLVLAWSLPVAAAPAAPAASGMASTMDRALVARSLERARGLARLHALIVARHGEVLVARAFRGPRLERPVNVKSVSKSVIAALVGAAIGRGLVSGTDAPLAAYLADRLPARADPRLRRVTIGNLLSMQAGLERTSGRNYGRWVNSPDWVRHALSRPFADEPGGRMLYSTGNSHLLSAILTRVGGKSTHALAVEWLGRPLGIDIPAWQRDPQGIYFGGNNMALSPLALLRLGELYRQDGLHEGRRILPAGWVRQSWTARAQSPFSGDDYGYGWFLTEMCAERVAYARGFGGQFIFVVPGTGQTIVITSDTASRTRVGGYFDALMDLVGDGFVRAALGADGRACPD
jgi:CubicO group peptidase (beta-lactamase class C family)